MRSTRPSPIQWRWKPGVRRLPPGPGLYRIGRLTERPINNAQLIGATIYRTRLELFDRWHLRHGGDVRRGVDEMKELLEGASGDSAYARLERAVAAD